MKKKVLVLEFVVMMIASLCMLTGCSGLKEKDRRNDFLDKLVDVSYVKVDGYNVDKKIDTKLAVLLNKIGSKSIDSKSTESSSAETGEQAYVFKLYSNDDNILYWLQYYSSNDKMVIYTCTGTDKNVSFKESHTIDDKEVVKYIKSVIK
ncbi:MAG: hypothetical protein IKE01_04760 [Clostridia bacterium]|nr:hypothetical protein [Clostridia bacterium]